MGKDENTRDGLTAVRTILALLGGGLLVAGVGLIHVPSAIIAAGTLIVLGVITGARTQ